jgi:hypothetical protein
MFCDASFQLVVNGDLSEPILRTCGLPQGLVLSPIVFDMFIDSLIRDLNLGSGDVPSCLFFADDGVLLCDGLGAAKRLFGVAEQWAYANGMTFNVSKCGAIVKTAESPILRLAGEVIPVVGEYTYLGFKINARGIDFGAQVSRQVESANAFLDFVKPRLSGWSHHTRKAVYSTFLRLKLEYGAPLVQAHVIKSKSDGILLSHQGVQDKAMRWIFHCPSKQTKVMRGILGELLVAE